MRITDGQARRLAWAIAVFVAAGFITESVFAWLNRSFARPTNVNWSGSGIVGFLTNAPLLGFPIVGLLLALKRPRNAIGWIMLGIGVSMALPFDGYAHYALLTRGGTLPGGAFAESLSGPTWIPLIGLSGIFLVLLFPDGHLPSPRWKWFARAAAAAMVVGMVAIGFAVLRYRLYDIDVVINRAVLYASLAVFISVVYVAIVVGIGAIVGSQGNAVLSALAAAVVALAFQPVRRRAQRFADRLVY